MGFIYKKKKEKKKNYLVFLYQTTFIIFFILYNLSIPDTTLPPDLTHAKANW